MTWSWRFEAADGTELRGPHSPPHSSQSDAESWLGEEWRALADDGVAQVTLLHGDTAVYGPMPLSEA